MNDATNDYSRIATTAGVTEAETGSLDPDDWSALRALGHRMLDDAFDDLAGLGDGPVWRKMPERMRAAWDEPLPREGAGAETVYQRYRDLIAPYAVGNRHPRFHGWVHGGGTAIGMLAELLAGALNANCGGRDHAPILVERQVIAWAAEMLGLPRDSTGLVLSGTSMANLVAVLVARGAALGAESRRTGIGAVRLTGYASAAAHLCVGRAFEMSGIGADALRLIRCDARGRIDPVALAEQIAADQASGCTPFLIVGSAGTVDTGAIDDLATLASIAESAGAWFHVDAAYGAIAMLSRRLRPLFAGMERADSVAFDFHKWAQVPYDAGCIVVRDGAAHRAAFARDAAYLRRDTRGLAAGEPWPVDLGPELSRGFRALKVWMTLEVYGADRIAAVADQSCALARRLADTITATPGITLAAPVALNVVCFRVDGVDDRAQTEIAVALQEAGETVLSTTTLDGRTLLRAAFVNHRTRADDVDAIVPAVLGVARRIARRG
jgi:aromatic-L-amino-acid decarboxylase